MIFASSLKPNGKMRFSATAGWTQVANGLRLTSTASAASVELHNDYGGLSLYNQQDFSIGVKVDRAPVTITNGIAANNNNYLAFVFTALGMLTVTRGYSSPTVTQINLTELGVDISNGIDLVQHWHYDGGVQVLDVYVNEVPVMLGSTRSPLQTTYNRIYVAAGAPAPVTLSEIYVKAGDPLLSWKVQDCELAVDNAQDVPLSSVGDSVVVTGDMRIAYTLVADEPPAEEIKEVIIEATVSQIKPSIGDKQNLRVAFAGKLLVDNGKLVNPEYGNQFAFNDLSHEEVASPVVVSMSNERSNFGTLKYANDSMYSVVDPVAGASGIYPVIAPDGTLFNAYVDMETDGGLWILSHRWISLSEAYSYNDMVVAGKPIKTTTTDASIYPCIPTGLVCETPYILLKHTESRWVASMTGWVKFAPLEPNTELGSAGFEAVNANGAVIRLYGERAGWGAVSSMDRPFGIMTAWGNSGLCGGANVARGAICPVAYPNPSGSYFDNSNVKEMYYKGAVAVAPENREKDTKPFAYFRFVDGSKDDVSSVYALLSSATVSVGKLHLEGTASSYMELPAFIPSNDFTIEMKFNPTEAGGKLIEVGTLLDIEIDTSLKFRMGAGKIITLDSEVSVTLSQECHVAVSSRNGIVQMFVDGVLAARGVSYGRLDPAQVKTLIGKGFKGTINDIRLSFDGLYSVEFEVQPLSEYVPDDSLDLGVLLQEEFLEGDEYGEL